MADKSVTPYPLDGWEYADPEDDVEAADGVRFVCGSFLGFEDAGCGEPFYVNFVRFEDGRKVEPPREQEHVEINVGTGPRWPSGPSGPAGPG